MKTEKQKMLSGGLYNAQDEQLTKDRIRTRLLLKKLNDSAENQIEDRTQILKELIPHAGKNLQIQPPFYCDYGYNIEIGDDVFFNFNCVVLDVVGVKIGNRVLFGPNVQIYPATHPLNHRERASGLESGNPITIGDDVWIGGSVIINPGVEIGDRTVIGAGSVVTKNIPADVFVAGNPCKIIRQLKS